MYYVLMYNDLICTSNTLPITKQGYPKILRQVQILKTVWENVSFRLQGTDGAVNKTERYQELQLFYLHATTAHI
jgi:hypothetical protein